MPTDAKEQRIMYLIAFPLLLFRSCSTTWSRTC